MRDRHPSAVLPLLPTPHPLSLLSSAHLLPTSPPPPHSVSSCTFSSLFLSFFLLPPTPLPLFSLPAPPHTPPSLSPLLSQQIRGIITLGLRPLWSLSSNSRDLSQAYFGGEIPLPPKGALVAGMPFSTPRPPPQTPWKGGPEIGEPGAQGNCQNIREVRTELTLLLFLSPGGHEQRLLGSEPLRILTPLATRHSRPTWSV